MSTSEHNYQQLPAELRGEARSVLTRVRAGASAMPLLAVAGALLLVAGAATWAGGAVAAKSATRQVFTWAGVEHALIDSLEMAVVAGSAVLIPWVVGLALYSAWWKGGSVESGGGNGGSGGGGGDSGTLLLSALSALAVSTLLLSATITWTADMDAARDRLGGGPGHKDTPGGGGGWGPPPAAPVPDPTAPTAAAAGGRALFSAYGAAFDPAAAPSAAAPPPFNPSCPAQCLDISAVVKVFKLPLPSCFCGQQWLLADLYTHMDEALRGLAAAVAGAAACWLGGVALLLWSAEERVLAVGGIFGGG